jgi:DNA gyrase subunit A
VFAGDTPGVIPDLHDGLDALSRSVLARLGDTYVQCSKLVRDEQEYDALVRLEQDWLARYPLVDGNGNFGSVDDDPPAEAQYTEARLMPLARELPRFPNLLVNGSDTIPGHNLDEVCAAVAAVAEDPSLGLREIMRHLPGPDFASGGIVGGAVATIYATGAGTLRVRARAHAEERQLMFSELPYGVCKGGEAGVIREIAEGVAERRISGISDIQDWTHREGMRLMVMAGRGVDTRALLQELYRETRLEIEYHVELTAMVDGEARRFTLRELIEAFIAEHGTDHLRAIAERFGDARRSTINPSD